MKTAHNIPVMMYHHVTEHGGFLDVSSRQFERQIRSLAENGYTALSAEQFEAFLRGEPMPRKSVLLTFDDGYLDNWVHAHPVLHRYGMKAILFAITGLIGNGPPRPHAGQGKPVPACPPHAQAKAQMFGDQPDDVMLRWSEVEAMRADRVFEFHSHTHTHTRWDLGPDKARKNEHMVAELEASRAILAERLGGVSQHFCWPQGYFDADYIRIAREAGFRYLYTTQAFGRNLPGHDPAHIHRFAVRNTSGQSVGRRIVVGSHPLIAPVFHRFKLWKRARRERS